MTAPTPRGNVAQIPAYVPGRPPPPRPGLTTYKLSSNENPYPPLPGVLEAATAAAGAFNRYPDLACTRLREVLAERLGVPVESLAAATGSVALIYQLLQTYCDPGDEVVHAWRSFEAYPIAITAAAATGVPVPLTASCGHDLDAMAAAVTDRTKVLFVCSPNNPTGPALTHTAVADFVARIPEDVVVVLDEAYVEFVRMADPLDAVAIAKQHDNVVVTRTFSKSYGLAGLRVGYAVAHPEVAGGLRSMGIPFGVSTIAQEAAIASLEREDELFARVDALVGERDRVTAALRSQGWEIPETQANFCWLGLRERTAEFAATAERAGIVVRPLGGDGARVTIGETEANDRFLSVAAEFIGA